MRFRFFSLSLHLTPALHRKCKRLVCKCICYKSDDKICICSCLRACGLYIDSECDFIDSICLNTPLDSGQGRWLKSEFSRPFLCFKPSNDRLKCVFYYISVHAKWLKFNLQLLAPILRAELNRHTLCTVEEIVYTWCALFITTSIIILLI